MIIDTRKLQCFLTVFCRVDFDSSGRPILSIKYLFSFSLCLAGVFCKNPHSLPGCYGFPPPLLPFFLVSVHFIAKALDSLSYVQYLGITESCRGLPVGQQQHKYKRSDDDDVVMMEMRKHFVSETPEMALFVGILDLD